MNESAIRDAIATGNRVDSFTTISALEQAVNWIISEAMQMRGQTGGETGMKDTTVKRVTDILVRDYPSFTDKELKLVMEAGISGELGRETWVSGASILQWLRAYSRHASRISIVDEQTEKTKQRHCKTKAEIDELNRRSFETKIHSAFEYYKEQGSIFGEDQRAFHLPQWAAIVYEHYRSEGKIPEPNAARIREAESFAEMKLIEHSTKKEFIPAAREDWMNSYFLEQYFSDVINRRL